jgi:hypothetical protein
MGSGGTGPAQLAVGRPILFIGNSLTYVNDLPLIVQALADSAGGERLAVQAVTAGGYSLEDHWNAGTAPHTIAGRQWSVVVLQQGPSSLPESRENLREWTRRFDAEIRRAGGRTALYMVWPEAARAAAFDAVVESYALAAADVHGMLFPVGEAWRVAWSRDAQAPLYGPDGFHPSAAGSYLAGLVMYGLLTGESPVGLPSTLRLGNGALLTIEPSLAAMLQAAAAEANTRFGRS